MDAIFKALNDPARRELLDSLRRKDGQTLTELESVLDMSRFGVMKHLKVLEAASLITSRKTGRFKHHYLNAVPLQEVIDRWIEPLIAKPAARGLIDLKRQLETTDMPLDTSDKPDFVHRVYINASRDAVWTALTDGDATRRYYFGTRLTGPLTDGSDYAYLDDGGRPMLSGRVLSVVPSERLEMTFEPGWTDLPPSRTVFGLSEDGGQTVLTLEHFDLPPDADGIRDGWARILSDLKTLLEREAL